MYNHDKLVEELIRDEGLRLEGYKDTVGLWTIGVGHMVKVEPKPITKEQALMLLTDDILDARERLTRIIPFWRNLNDVRQRAIINMSFNLGNRLSSFLQFINALKLGDWTRAGSQMASSKWAIQVGDRAVRLRKMIETGEDA